MNIESDSGRKLRLSGVLFIVVIVLYTLNVCGILFTVIFDSVSTNFSGFLPTALTGKWYAYVAYEHDIVNLLVVTFVVSISVVAISLAIAYPTAYALARTLYILCNNIFTSLRIPNLFTLSSSQSQS